MLDMPCPRNPSLPCIHEDSVHMYSLWHFCSLGLNTFHVGVDERIYFSEMWLLWEVMPLPSSKILFIAIRMTSSDI